jgi:hypothetical protein
MQILTTQTNPFYNRGLAAANTAHSCKACRHFESAFYRRPGDMDTPYGYCKKGRNVEEQALMLSVNDEACNWNPVRFEQKIAA